jgi:hypothetical protein
MNEEQTWEFINEWNLRNRDSLPNRPVGMMTYEGAGLVSWNKYDAPMVDINEFMEIYHSVVQGGL